MNETPSTSRKLKNSTILWLGTIIAALLIAVLTWFYYAEPLSESVSPYWNDKVVDVIALILAVEAALFTSMLTGQFEPGEPPRRIWLAFAIGWWWWVAGEVAGIIYDIFYFDPGYPDLTLIDLCWTLGYLFFGLSLYYQFRAIYGNTPGRKIRVYFMIIALGLVVTLGLTQLALRFGLGEGIGWFALYLAVLYPVFDLAEGAGAIWLSFLFGRGQWVRPWWGLIAFAIADGINIYFWIGGDQRLPERTALILDSFSTAMYGAGYAISALGVLSIYLVMRRGTVRKGEMETVPA